MPQEQVYDYALTTLQRVKDRMGITVTDSDAVLTRLVNAMTDFIEKQCGGRRFLQTAYTNEMYSVYAPRAEYITLKQAPVTQITSFQYSVSQPPTSSKVWNDFLATNWELLEDGKSGLIRVYQSLFKGINVVRCSYTAGYLIDWPNAGDSSTHTLPADLTDLCERFVVKLYKKRNSEGKDREGLQQSVIIWSQQLVADDDQDTLDNYTRIPILV
jgi:hypothetical protein